MNEERRSFLKLLVAALTLPKAIAADVERALVTEPARLKAYNYMAFDTVIGWPQGFKVRTFFPPLPRNFSVTGIKWLVKESMPLEDLRQLVQGVTFSLHSDGQQISSGPLSTLPWGGLGIVRPGTACVRSASGHGEPQTVFPALAPRKDFYLDFAAPKLNLTEPASFTVQVDGVVGVAE